MALRFAALGAKVAVSGRREEPLREVAKELAALYSVLPPLPAGTLIAGWPVVLKMPVNALKAAARTIVSGRVVATVTPGPPPTPASGG